MYETATLVFASDEESEAEISDSDVDFPLTDGENEPITSVDSSDEEGETTRPRHAVNSLDATLMEENSHPLLD